MNTPSALHCILEDVESYSRLAGCADTHSLKELYVNGVGKLQLLHDLLTQWNTEKICDDLHMTLTLAEFQLRNADKYTPEYISRLKLLVKLAQAWKRGELDVVSLEVI